MSSMQAEQQSYSWIKDLVHKLKWTYGALWTLNTSRPLIGFDAVLGVAEWKDGWYNLDLSRSNRTLAGDDNTLVRDESRNEALFYSSYKSCSFQQGFGYVGLVLLRRQSTWMTGSRAVLERAVHTQALFLKTARIQTVMCIPWNNHVLELGKFEQESRNEHILHQIQRWLSGVTIPPLTTQPRLLGVVSEDDSGRSCDAMQMSLSIASSIFTHSSNVNVHFVSPSSSDLLIKQQRNNTHATGSFSTSSPSDAPVPVHVPKRISLVRYPPQQSTHDAVSRLSHRVPSITGHEKSSLEMGTSFAEDWDASTATGTSDIFQQVTVHDSDPIIPCSGMAIPGISSLLPADTFSQQDGHDHPSGGEGGGISLAQALLTSLPMTMPPDIDSHLPLPMDLLQESSANIFCLPSKNSREWPALEPPKAQSLVQMLEEFTEEDHLQRLHSPDHALIQTAVGSSSETMGDWVEASAGTAPIPHHHHHHHHYDHHSQQREQQQQQRAVQRQLEFPHIPNPIVNNLQNMSTPRPVLASLMTHQQQHHQPQQQLQHQSPLVPHGQQPQGPRWPISFTSSTAWVRWVARKQAGTLRYKARDPNGASHAVLRVNQMVLKKVLTEMVPKIAQEQKARQEEREGQALETETLSHGVRMISYPTTTATRQESGSVQDPQARTHMLAERRRRVRENEHYAALRKLIPPTSRMDKATVLAETIQLVKRLKRRVRQLEKVNPDNSGMPNLSLVTSEDSQIGTTSQSSRGDPGSPTPARAGSSGPEEGNPPSPHSDFAVPAPASPSLEDNKEMVEVDAQACGQHQLRAKIRTYHRPNTVIHVLTCLKDLDLEVLSTSISIEKDWVQADFQLKINVVHSSRVSQFTEELQQALRKVVFPPKSNADSILEGGSFTQDSGK